MNHFYVITVFTGILVGCQAINNPDQSKKNVLLILADDLRPELGCYGMTHIQSPNIDKLASEGIVFSNAFVQVPVCGASRASLMTGLRPVGSRFRQWDCRAEIDTPDAPTLNAFFKKNGYHTIANGKVYHYDDDSKEGWSEPVFHPKGNNSRFDYLIPENYRQDKGENRGPAFEIGPGDDEDYIDGKILAKSIDDLKRMKNSAQPFFMAVGFKKPHLPFNAPKKYWDMYDRSAIQLPQNPVAPVNAPTRSLHNFGELRSYSNIPDNSNTDPLDIPLSKDLIHGYYACVSYIDELIGRLLDELAIQGLTENTIVMIIGDHGWNLLEHGLWCKHANYRTALTPAFLMKVPGMKQNLKSDAIVELVDVFPTLCDLTGLTPPENLGGLSLVPVLSGESGKVKDHAFSRWYDGYSVISQNFIYTEWWNSTGETIDKMLYDHRSDPGENYNVADDPEYENVITDLSESLRNSFGIKQ